MTSCFRKNAPSQTAHALTPLPFSACSLSRPSHLACAPVAMMSVSAVCSTLSSPAQTRNGRFERSTLFTSSVRISTPWCSDWARNAAMRSGPVIFAGKPG